MTITLSDDVAATLEEQVRAGKFGSAEAAVAFGVSIVDGFSADQLEKLQELRRGLARADQDVLEGRVRPMQVEDAIAQAKAIHAARQRS